MFLSTQRSNEFQVSIWRYRKVHCWIGTVSSLQRPRLTWPCIRALHWQSHPRRTGTSESRQRMTHTKDIIPQENVDPVAATELGTGRTPQGRWNRWKRFPSLLFEGNEGIESEICWLMVNGYQPRSLRTNRTTWNPKNMVLSN